MKFSKTALVSSLALCGITLGAVAPTTVSAATSAGSIINGAYDSTPNNNAHLLEGDWVNATDGHKATADSDANVTVVSGFLTLDSVPDFSFGRAVPNKTVRLHQGHSEIKDDGNTNGDLQITESRSDSTTAKNNGFTISAQMANFKTKGSANPNNGKEVAGFKLNLFPTDLVDVNSGKSTGLQTNQTTLNGGGDSADVLTAKASDKLLGTYLAKFIKPEDASLFVPDAAKTDDGKVGVYSGVITWTLATGAGATDQNNNGGGTQPQNPTAPKPQSGAQVAK